MKVRMSGVLLGTALLAAMLATPARASDKSEIQALFDKVAKCVITKDVKGLPATSTADFTYTEDGKTMTGKEISAQMDTQLKAVKGPISCKFIVTSLTITGKKAAVKVTDNTVMTVPGKDGKPHKMGTSTLSTGEVVKTSKGWLLKSITVVSNKYTMDGKPFTPPAGGAESPSQSKQ
jgi:hypothetical protein